MIKFKAKTNVIQIPEPLPTMIEGFAELGAQHGDVLGSAYCLVSMSAGPLPNDAIDQRADPLCEKLSQLGELDGNTWPLPSSPQPDAPPKVAP